MLNYEIDIAPRLAENKTAAEIAAEINAARRLVPANYGPISHRGVTLWLSNNGLLIRLERWLSAASPTEQEYASSDPVDVQKVAVYQQFGSAIRGLIAAMGASDWSLDFSPGSSYDTLMTQAVAAGIMTSTDKAFIQEMAYIGGNETEATVQDAVDRYQSISSWWSRYVTAGAIYLEQNPSASKQDILSAIQGVE